jgi:hypothetical protein
VSSAIFRCLLRLLHLFCWFLICFFCSLPLSMEVIRFICLLSFFLVCCISCCFSVVSICTVGYVYDSNQLWLHLLFVFHIYVPYFKYERYMHRHIQPNIWHSKGLLFTRINTDATAPQQHNHTSIQLYNLPPPTRNHNLKSTHISNSNSQIMLWSLIRPFPGNRYANHTSKRARETAVLEQQIYKLGSLPTLRQRETVSKGITQNRRNIEAAVKYFNDTIQWAGEATS